MPAQSALITVMAKAAEKAARGLKRDFGEVENLQVTRKGPGDFVSNADKNAEKVLHEELAKARPGYSFLMEESGAVGDQKNAEGRWIIDPLDGTSNFLHGIPHWNISIGCEQKGELVAGVVFDPIKDEMFWAEKGSGAYLNNRRLRVSARKDLGDATIGCAVVRRQTELHAKFLKQAEIMIPVAGALRRFGAAALDLAYVAAGRFDGYWENFAHAWDFAAGIVILREAGGMVTHIDGRSYQLGDNDLLASNGNLHTELVKLLKKAA